MQGARGKLVVHRWGDADADYVVVIAHGLGEHAGRHGHKADHRAVETLMALGHSTTRYRGKDGKPDRPDNKEFPVAA